MSVSVQASCSQLQEKPNVFVLHCGLDIKRVERCCETLGLQVNIIHFRREEVFAYYLRLARPSPNLIVIRSHFRSLIDSMNLPEDIPTVVVSTHQEPENCCHPYIQAHQGYEGTDASKLYRQLCMAIVRKLSFH